MKAVNRRVVAQFRAGEEVEGMHRERLLLLTTTGSRSGARHTTPMMFHRDGAGRLLVIASNAGATRDPDWFRTIAGGYVYTKDLARGQRMIERLQTGMMGLNLGVVSNAAAPFGGVFTCAFPTGPTTPRAGREAPNEQSALHGSLPRAASRSASVKL